MQQILCPKIVEVRTAHILRAFYLYFLYRSTFPGAFPFDFCVKKGILLASNLCSIPAAKKICIFLPFVVL